MEQEPGGVTEAGARQRVKMAAACIPRRAAGKQSALHTTNRRPKINVFGASTAGKQAAFHPWSGSSVKNKKNKTPVGGRGLRRALTDLAARGPADRSPAAPCAPRGRQVFGGSSPEWSL